MSARRTAVAAAAMAAALAAADAAAVLYRWTDAQGRIQYSDQPPKNFKGEVTRIEPDEQPPPVVRPAPKAVAAPKAAEAERKPGIAEQRRTTREKLGAELAQARERHEAAKRALEQATQDGPEPEERQVIQQRVSKGGNPMPQPIPNRDAGQGRQAGGGMHGMTARSNCREAPVAGGKAVVCATMVPGEAYRERIARLEEELARAEEALAAAESAYRRGVD